MEHVDARENDYGGHLEQASIRRFLSMDDPKTPFKQNKRKKRYAIPGEIPRKKLKKAKVGSISDIAPRYAKTTSLKTYDDYSDRLGIARKELNDTMKRLVKQQLKPPADVSENPRLWILREILAGDGKIIKRVETAQLNTVTNPDVPSISRAYIAGYRRPPIKEWHERPCVRNNECISKIYGGPILTEFILPERLAKIKKIRIRSPSGKTQFSHQARMKYNEELGSVFPSRRQLCIMCNHRLVNELYNMIRGPEVEINARHFDKVIQNHGVIVNVEGEYNERYCIFPRSEASCLIKPIPTCHKKFFYRSTVRIGGKSVFCWAEKDMLAHH